MIPKSWRRADWVDGPPRGELDAFFAEYVGDVFAAFGYRRRGAHWTKVSPNGDTSAVWFQRTLREYAAAFYVEPGFWTALYEEAARRRGEREKVTASEGLWHGRLTFVEQPEEEWSDEWVYGTAESRARVGEQLRRALETQSLPRLESLRDRWAVVEELSGWDRVTAREDGFARPPQIAMAYLAVDVADPGSGTERARTEELIEGAAALWGEEDDEVVLFREVWQRRLKGE
jgi:hypothetical protein